MRYIINYVVTLYMIACTVVMTSLLITLTVYAEERHGPGWKSSNCDNIIDPDQAVVCNMMWSEQLIIDEYGWEVWEFDDSYIVLHDQQEVFQWDCVLDNDTDKANLFFCEAIMGYDYDKIYQSFDLSSNSNSVTN